MFDMNPIRDIPHISPSQRFHNHRGHSFLERTAVAVSTDSTGVGTGSSGIGSRSSFSDSMWEWAQSKLKPLGAQQRQEKVQVYEAAQ
ncbi:hypothetical protein AGMMS49531_08660 [Endomicrobiia bacterium]|nr:hypothetical protein AGMMS49531_08660 [Endomicrobiia bacterium]